MVNIGSIPAGELAGAAEANIVSGITVGVDLEGRGAVIKFRTASGGEFTYFFQSNACHQWAVAIRKSARKHRWKTDDTVLNDSPDLTPDDWNAGLRQVGPTRLETYPDAAIVALQRMSSDVVTAFRLSPHAAIFLGTSLWEQFRLQPKAPNAAAH